jgi:hypothetical protein
MMQNTDNVSDKPNVHRFCTKVVSAKENEITDKELEIHWAGK